MKFIDRKSFGELRHWLQHHGFNFSTAQQFDRLTDKPQHEKSTLAEASAVIELRNTILSTDDPACLTGLDKSVHLLDNAANISLLEELIKQRRDELLFSDRRH